MNLAHGLGKPFLKHAVRRVRRCYCWQIGCVCLGRAFGSLYDRNFIVLASARSGSRLLVNYLNSHPQIRCHGEVLNSPHYVCGKAHAMSRRRLRHHVKSFYLKGRTVGTTFHTHHFEDIPIRADDIVEILQRPKVLVLYRENQLESYVSLTIARQSNIWYSTSIVNKEAITVDWHKYLAYVDHERKLWDACLKSVQSACAVHTVTFEQMVAAPQATLDDVFTFLGVPSCHIWTESVRQNPRPLSEKILNYSDLRIEDPARAKALNLSLMSQQENSLSLGSSPARATFAECAPIS
jgi:LPS sulfotransferase NodH